MTRTSTRPDLVVLEATGAPDGTTRYIDQVVTFAPAGVRFIYLSLWNLLFTRCDVIHFHWPEVLVRGRGRASTMVRSAFLLLVLTSRKLRGVAIVRTVHNVQPHEAGGAIERLALRVLDRATDHFVVINSVTPPQSGPTTTILHGHYRSRFADHAKLSPVPGRVLYAGLIRPYKGVESLLEVFDSLKDPCASLRIVGKPTDELRRTVERAVEKDRRVTSRLEFVPDEALVQEMTSAQFVCLPYRELHNSGVLMVALSLGRPVLVPDTPATRALEEELSTRWIWRFEGELKATDLSSAIERARALSNSDTQPDLSGRDWETVAAKYASVFREAASANKKEAR